MQPKIDHVYELLALGVFTNLSTGAQTSAGRECTVRQLMEAPGEPLLPYEEDPLIIRVETLVVGEIYHFTDTNEPVDAVIWSDPQGTKYACAITAINDRVPGAYWPALA